MKRVLFAAFAAFAVGIYANGNSNEGCHYDPAYRQTLADDYNEAAQRYDDQKQQERNCRNNYYNKGKNPPPGACSYGALISQADQNKLNAKNKLLDYDRKTQDCR